MIKTYKCPVHGEFEYECNIGEEELKECPIVVEDKNSFIKFDNCNQPVTRVYKPTGYSFHTEGFCGKGFSIPNYK